MHQLPITPPQPASVKGMFIGVYLETNAPVLFKLEDVEFLPIFSTPEKFEWAMRFAKIQRYKIQIITDHNDFMDSVAGKIRLMLDPWHTDHGTTRWTELLPQKIADDPNFPP